MRPVIKICGIMCPDIAYQAASLGADYMGIVFHEESKRYIDFGKANAVVASAIRGGAIPVAVCVNQTENEMIRICNDLNINVIQLHGDTAREQYQKLPDRVARIYVLHVDKLGNIINHCESLMKQLRVDRDYLLFDGLLGGSGERIKLDQVQDVAGEFKYFVAGGIADHNVCDIMDLCSPYGVDVSTGVENLVGKKDVGLIKHFISRINDRGGRT